MEQKIFTQRTEDEVLSELKELPGAYRTYQGWNEELRDLFMAFCMGKKTLPVLYDTVFKILMNPDTHPERLEDLYLAGFRMSTLGWNEKNPLTGSCKTGGGLTDLGREYVNQAQKRGMIIDVSHISDEGFWDIVKITQAPIVASHSNSRMVCNVERNLTDDMFRAICETDGVVGINLYSAFLGKHPTIDTVCDHIFHFVELDPSGKHISLGGDLDGCEALPEGFSGIQDYQKLAQRLLQRGLGEEMLQNIFWNNAIGVMKRCSI